MALNDVRIHKSPYDSIPTVTWQTDAAATAITAGDLLKMTAAGGVYVTPLVDADLTIGTDTQIAGVAASAGSHTATADGTVEVYLPLPGVIWEMAVTTAANFDTQAEIDALQGDRVTIDVTALVQTLDENDGDGATNAFYIVGGDPDRQVAYFTIRADATWLSGESV